MIAPPRPNVPKIPSVKYMIAVGAGFDIPTGVYLEGVHGQMCLNGGLGAITAITGMGNSFKSTILHFMALSAASRVGKYSYIDTYDTEMNVQPHRLSELAKSISTVGNEDWIENGRWRITDSSVCLGNKWFSLFKESMLQKINDSKEYLVDTPFLDKDKGKSRSCIKVIYPTFQEIDSLSKFTTADVVKIQDKNELGDPGGNTVSMRQGLQKTRLLDELPSLATGSNTYILMTAHYGKEINLDPYSAPTKQLPDMKHNQKIKGVPLNFTYLITTCWHVEKCEKLLNNDKTILFPKEPEDKALKIEDLNLVTLKKLRSKNGSSGSMIKVIVSQEYGVLPSLTEFYHIRTNQFGFIGNDKNYKCVLYQDVNLNRVNIRKMLAEHKQLERAINILSEYLQLIINRSHQLLPKYNCTPEELYQGVIDQGYDWEMILTQTRGYPTVNNEDELLELSTLDILRMRVGDYHPFWLDKDKKTILKKFTKNVT